MGGWWGGGVVGGGVGRQRRPIRNGAKRRPARPPGALRAEGAIGELAPDTEKYESAETRRCFAQSSSVRVSNNPQG